MSMGKVMKTVKPYLAMVFLQFGFSGMYIIAVASLKKGMNHYVLVVYRNAFAAAIMAPFALYFERKARPKMTIPVFLKIVAMGILEPVLDQNFYYVGAKATSASYGAALYNILPAITFVMAILLRMEKVNIKQRRSQAKVIGTLITVGGALLMILYKGPIVNFVWNKGRTHHFADADSSQGSNWFKGTIMLLGSCISWSGFYIVQANTLQSYPAEISLSTLICLSGAILSAGVTLVMEGLKSEPWMIGMDMRLFTVVYSVEF